tara:strand:+ start:2843 stop:3697 length:855 start_codon:yes stop_codon:yes gene_type:complete
MIFTYQTRETSLYNKNNTKLKNNIVVSKLVPPPTDFLVNQTVYKTIYAPITQNGSGGSSTHSNHGNKTREIKHPQRNPIRHYRRELTHESYNTTHDRQIINNFNMPGKTIVTNSKDDCYNCLDNNFTAFKQEIYPNGETFIDGVGYQDISQNIWKCISCNPESNQIKRASTNYSKSYSPSIKNLLQKRMKTYDQNVIYDMSKNYIVNNKNVVCKNIKKTLGGVSGSHYSIKNGYKTNNNNTSNILMNSICCNNILSKSIYNNSNSCTPPTCSNRLLQKKNICNN